jgi:uncharacterized protein (DUF885 family)
VIKQYVENTPDRYRFGWAHALTIDNSTMNTLLQCRLASYGSLKSFSRFTGVIAVGLLCLAACSRSTESNSSTTQSSAASATQGTNQIDTLDKLVAEYFERLLELNPVMATDIGDYRYNDRFANDISKQWLADSLALEQEFLKRVNALDASKYTEAERLTYDTFKYGRQMEIDGYVFRSELLPLNQFYSTPSLFAQMGSGQSIQPFATVKHYDDFLKRIDGFVIWMDQAIANLKEGVDDNIVLPKVIVERILPQLTDLIVDDPKTSIFYKPLSNLPKGISENDSRRLHSAYSEAISKQLMPAYKRLRDYLKNDYLDRARTTDGMSALPQGQAWYAYQVRRNTTTSLTPEQIHEIGLKEIARIRGEMERIKTQVHFEGDLKQFMASLRSDPKYYYKNPEDLLNGYRSLKADVTAALPRLFSIMPKADFEVRAVESFRERSASTGAYQSGTPDGKRPGVFYANTYDLSARPRYMMQAIFLHEALPGHHMQISLQFELPNLPSFRRFSNDTAYVEGWGLYSESLGRELGQYSDPYDYFGALTAESWRAARLVVDTGLHAKGWTREQAIDYLRDNTAIGDSDVTAEIERYMVIPGQALAYKMGQLKIRELRTRAEQKLGNKFDVRDFHTQILKDGSMPLSVLEAKIDRWIQTRN